MMKVIGVNIGKEPEIIEIDGSLNSLQEYVGGWIEAIYPFEDSNISLICNEEGKIMGLRPNRFLSRNDRLLDCIFGNFLLVGVGEEDFESLTDEQIDYCLSRVMTDIIVL